MKGAISLRAAALAIAVATTPLAATGQDLVVGCKNFTEQFILGEIVAQSLERHAGLEVGRRFGLGGTGICHGALIAGEIDVYVEYTGTAFRDILGERGALAADAVYRRVAAAYRDRFDLEWAPPFGFENTYVMLALGRVAHERNWRVFSDVGESKELRGGFTAEFIERPDGLAALRRGYGFAPKSVRDLDPAMIYQALESGAIDIGAGFSTDGQIDALKLAVIADDRRVFPPYFAAPVVRRGALERFPDARIALNALAGTIDAGSMRRMNAAVTSGRTAAAVAGDWLAARGDEIAVAAPNSQTRRRGLGARLKALAVERRSEILAKLLEHCSYVAVAVLIAAVIGIPAGILCARRPRAAAWVLGFGEVLQTIPSLAMLSGLFAIIGRLGALPAVAALVLYALLPLTLNTVLGMTGVARSILESADAVGLTRRQRLFWVELPLARPAILTGLRAATVAAVGTATLSTYVGAGALGDFIARGLARNDPALTLIGAAPAAALALALSWILRRAAAPPR